MISLTRLVSLISVCSLLILGCVESVSLENQAGESIGSSSLNPTRSGGDSPLETSDSGSQPPPLRIYDMAPPSPMPLDSSVEPERDPPPQGCGALMMCGGRCVDITSDQAHCGACQSACSISNGVGECINGRCLIVACDPGYEDQDRRGDNGCEFFDDCESGLACMTSCGSIGATMCSRGSTTCAPPLETCTLSDEDCDGLCDENSAELNCRVGVHRGFGGGYHIYSSALGDVTSGEYLLEVTNYFYLYPEAHQDTSPLSLCTDLEGRASLSTQSSCNGGSQVRVIGHLLNSGGCGAQPLYALYRPENGNHFYTIDPDEVEYAIRTFNYERRGTLGYIWRNP